MFKSEKQFDVLVIGSGLAGIHAAYPLVIAGKNVVMLDVGNDESHELESGPADAFTEQRKKNPLQHEIFLGRDLSGMGVIHANGGHVNFMTSGRRNYIQRNADTKQPIQCTNATIIQTLAKGGLSEAWGGVCGIFNKEECNAVGLNYDEMKPHYAAIIKHIGVSGFHLNFQLQEPASLDDNSSEILNCYIQRKATFDRSELQVSQPMLALLTQNIDSRLCTQYRDMDFWDNVGRSVYRGHYTLEELNTYNNFTYSNNILVTTVKETGNYVTVYAQNTYTNEELFFSAKTLILAAGAINTTRIVLKSFEQYTQPIPVILKNNYLIPCIQIKRLGKVTNIKRHSLCQLIVTSTATADISEDIHAQLYSYNSLLLFKLLSYIPLPIREALTFLSFISSAIILVDVRFHTPMNAQSLASLEKNKSGDTYLKITHTESVTQRKSARAKLHKLKKALFQLGLVPLTTISNQPGSASHYAGGVPISTSQTHDRICTDTFGRLQNSKHIFIADSATWNALPAKPPALSIMANAHRIGCHIRDTHIT